ncbi:MAG: metallophosphoesterase family protein [Methanocorpusculum sp.]|jgi:acid phosphatase type 7|nr:metallophosphoesterase family protein [Methanocorpusculum sp.]
MKRFGILILLLLLLVPAVSAAELPRWGPYITSLDEETVTIHYCLYENASGGVAITSGEITSLFSSDPAAYHHICIQDLTPDTAYSYRILVNGSWSEAYSFRTFGAENYTFVVSGDTRSEPPFTQIERHGVVALAIEKEHPLFVVHLGDFSGEANDPEEWDQFFSAGHDLYANTIIIPVQGNHDHSSLYDEIFGMPDWYAFSAGSLRFLVLNTNGWTQTRFEDQTVWLSEETADTGAKIAFFHHPFYTTDQKRTGLTLAQIPIWQKIFETGEVAATYSAHMHAYERYVSGGVTYVTNGAGGAPLYPPVTQPAEEQIAAIYHTLGFVRVDVSGSEFTSTFFKVAEASEDNSALTKTFPEGTIGDRFGTAAQVSSPIGLSALLALLCVSIFIIRRNP